MNLSDYSKLALPASDPWLNPIRAFDEMHALLQSEARTEPAIAAMLAQVVVGSRAYAERVRKELSGWWARPSPHFEARIAATVPMVIHNGREYGLVCQEPGYPEDFERALGSLLDRGAAGDELRAWGEYTTAHLARDPSGSSAAGQARLRFAQLARDSDWELIECLARLPLIVVGKQPTRRTACPSPSWGASLRPDGAAAGTIGVVIHDPSSMYGATTALHAVGTPAPPIGSAIYVNGRRGTLARLDLRTDSCFIELDGACAGPCRAVRGPAQLMPRFFEVAEFEGATTGRSQARVESISPAVVAPTPLATPQLFTDPVTSPGDSGAALVDGDGYVLAFAFETTAPTARVAHSSWVWAPAAYEALKLV